MPPHQRDVAYCGCAACRMVITAGSLQPAVRMATATFSQDDRRRVQTGVRVKCRPCGRKTVPVPAQIDLGYPHINPSGRISFQKNLEGLPGLQSTGIAVSPARHIDGLGPGTCHCWYPVILIPFFHYSTNGGGDHGRLGQRDGIEYFCRNTMLFRHTHVSLRDIMQRRPRRNADCHQQQRHQKAATRHPSAPC